MTDRLVGDRPISHPKDDALGLANFANALATSLLQMSPKDGLVISVEGPWGAGKSSAIALAIRTIEIRVLSGMAEGRDELEKLTEIELDGRWKKNGRSRKTHIVRFNPWNFSGQDNLVRAFFCELAGQIDVAPEGALKKALNAIAGYLPSVAGSVAAGTMLLAGNVPAAAAAGAGARAIGEVGERALKSEASLEGLKATLTATLREADQRIIVIVDDLDRLMPSEMRAMLSLVKSLGDLPNVLYVLSFDVEIVHKALQQSTEKIDPAFLEKIVQVSLKLPPPWRHELRQLLVTRLNAIIGEVVPADQDRWRRMFIETIDPYLATPRDVTRLLNTLQVIWPNVVGDVDLADLVAITTIQLFDPDVYALIRDEIESITHADYRFEDDKNFGERMLPKSARKPEIAKESMAHLFPRLAKAWNVLTMDGTAYIIQKEQRRICTKEYHRNYFVFGRDTRMLSRSEVEAIITAADPSTALAAAIKRLDSGTDQSRAPSVATLLEQIGDATYAKPLLTPALLCAVLDHSDDLIRRGDEVWELFVTRNFERIRNIVQLGLKRLDLSQRSEILKTLVNHRSGLLVRADAVQDDSRRHGLYGHQQSHESEWLFPADKIEKAAQAIKDQVAGSCKKGAVWQSPHPIDLIWIWRRMSDAQTLNAWFELVFEDDNQLVALANALPGKSYQSSGRDGSRVTSVFNRKDYKDLLDIDAMIVRLEIVAEKNSDAARALAKLRDAEKNSRNRW